MIKQLPHPIAMGSVLGNRKKHEKKTFQITPKPKKETTFNSKPPYSLSGALNPSLEESTLNHRTFKVLL